MGKTLLDLDSLKEYAKKPLQSGSPLLSTANRYLNNIVFPEDANFNSDLRDIMTSIDNARENIAESIKNITNVVDDVKYLENTNKRIVEQIERTKYRFKDLKDTRNLKNPDEQVNDDITLEAKITTENSELNADINAQVEVSGENKPINQNNDEKNKDVSKEIEQLEEVDTNSNVIPQQVLLSRNIEEIDDLENLNDVNGKSSGTDKVSRFETKRVPSNLNQLQVKTNFNPDFTNNYAKETQADVSDNFIVNIIKWLAELWNKFINKQKEITLPYSKLLEGRKEYNEDAIKNQFAQNLIDTKTNELTNLLSINSLEELNAKLVELGYEGFNSLDEVKENREDIIKILGVEPLICLNITLKELGYPKEITTLAELQEAQQVLTNQLNESLANETKLNAMRVLASSNPEVNAQFMEAQKVTADIQKKLDAVNGALGTYQSSVEQIEFALVYQGYEMKIAQENNEAFSNEVLNSDKFNEDLIVYAKKQYDLYAQNNQNAQDYATWVSENQDDLINTFIDLKYNEWKIDKYYSTDNLTDKQALEFLDESEISTYNYIYVTAGNLAADEYLDFMREELNNRQGQKEAEDFLEKLDGSNSDYVHTALEGYVDGLSSYANGIGNWITGDENLDVSDFKTMYIMQKISSEEQYKQYLDEVYNISSTLGTMAIPTLVTTAVSIVSKTAGVKVAGAFSTLTKSGKILKTAQTIAQVSYSASMGGNAYDQALESGHSKGKSAIYGLSVIATEFVLEKYVGGIPGLSNNSKHIIIDSISEGGEEAIEAFTDGILRSTILGEQVSLVEMKNEAKEGFKLGVITGFVKNGESRVIDGVTYTITDFKFLTEKGNASAYIDSLVKAEINGKTFEEVLIKQNPEMYKDYVEFKNNQTEVKTEIDNPVENLTSETNNTKPSSKDSKPIIYEDVYSYSDQRTNVGAEFHNQNQSDISSDYTRGDIDSPINLDNLASSIKTKLSEINTEANKKLDSLEKSIEGTTDIYSDSNSAVSKFSKAADLSKQIIDKKADTLIGEIESEFANLINQDVIKKKDDINIHFDALANAVDGTAEDIEAKIQNDPALNPSEYTEFVNEYKNGASPSNNEPDEILDVDKVSTTLETDLEKIRNNAQKDMDSFLEEIGIKTEVKDTGQNVFEKIKNDASTQLDQLEKDLGLKNDTASSDTPIYEDVYSYSDLQSPIDNNITMEQLNIEEQRNNPVAQLNANPADSYKQLAQNNSEVGLSIPNANDIQVTSKVVNDAPTYSNPKELAGSSVSGMLGQAINNGLQTVKSKFDTSNAIPVDFVEVDDTDNSNGSIPLIDKTAPDVLGLPSSSFGGMLSQVIPGTMTVIPSIFENVESVVVDATNIVENTKQATPKIETLDDMSWLDDDVITDYESINDALFKKDEANTKIEYEAELGFNQVSQVVDGLTNQLANFNDLYIRKKSLFSFNSERARGLKTLNIRLNDVINMINSFKRQGLEPNVFAKKAIDALEQGAVYVKKEFSSLDDAITIKSRLQQAQSELLANLRSLNDQLQIINQGNITLNSDAKGIIEQINSLTEEINDLKYQTDKLDMLMKEQNAEIKKAQTLNRELIDTIDSSRFLNVDDINASRSLTDILEVLKRKYHKINNDLTSLDSSIDQMDRMIQSQVVAINNFFEENDSFNGALKEITLEKVSSSPDNLVSSKLTSEQIYELASVSLNKNVPTLWEVVISDLKKLDINQKRKFITSLNNADLINQLSPTQFFNLCQDPETFNILIKNNLPRVARLFAKNITKPQVIGLLADLDPNQINVIFNESQVKEIINQMDPKQVWNLLALYNSKSYKWTQTEAILDKIISYNLEDFNEFLKNMSYFYIDIEGSNQLIKSANYSKYIDFINTINTKFYTVENLKLYPKMIDKVNSFLIFNNIEPIIKIRDNIKITTNEFYKTLSTKIIENSDITMNLNSDNKLSFNVEEGKTYDLVFMVNDKVNKKSYTAYSSKISIEDLLTRYSKEILNNKVSIKSFELNEIKSKLSITLENGYSKGLHLISLIVDGTKYDKLIEVRQFLGKDLNQDFPNAKSVEILSDKVIEYKPLNVKNNGIYKINYRIGDLENSFYLGAKENNGAYILDVQSHILANQLVGAEILNWEVFDVTNVDSSNLLINSMSGMSEIFTGIKYGGNQSDVSDIILNYYNNKLDNNILEAKAKVLEDIVKKYYPDATQMEIINLTASYAECGCGYMAISNALTTYALSNEMLKNNFSKMFGYDLYFEDEKGKWYNTDAIALDIYLGLFAHDSSIKEMINNDGGLNQQFLEHKDLKSFFDKHNLKFTPYATFNSTYEQLMADIINSKEYGYFTILAAQNFDMEQMTNNRKFTINSDKSLEDSRKIGAVREKVGGHAMLITDIDEQHNLIVSSWSDKYKYIPESLKKYEDSYMKLFNVKFELKEG